MCGLGELHETDEQGLVMSLGLVLKHCNSADFTLTIVFYDSSGACCLRTLFTCMRGDTYRMPPSVGDAGNVRGVLRPTGCAYFVWCVDPLRHGRLRRSFWARMS